MVHTNAEFDTDFRPTDHEPLVAALYLPRTVLTLNFVYYMNDSSTGSGTYTLTNDFRFSDQLDQTGAWFYVSGQYRLKLLYDPGFACKAYSVGTFFSPTQVLGYRFCTDGSGVAGIWGGNVVTGTQGNLMPTDLPPRLRAR